VVIKHISEKGSTGDSHYFEGENKRDVFSNVKLELETGRKLSIHPSVFADCVSPGHSIPLTLLKSRDVDNALLILNNSTKENFNMLYSALCSTRKQLVVISHTPSDLVQVLHRWKSPVQTSTVEFLDMKWPFNHLH